MPTYIYGLIDPTTHLISYIGKSDTPYERWEQHVTDVAQTLKTQWLRKLKVAGVHPTLVLLETIEDDGDWRTAEKWWVTTGLRMEWPLANTALVSAAIPPGPQAQARLDMFDSLRLPESKPLPIRLTAQYISEQLHVADSTIRFWIRQYAEFVPHTGEGRAKRYPPEAIEILQKIVDLTRLGLTTDMIRAELAAQRDGLPSPISSMGLTI